MPAVKRPSTSTLPGTREIGLCGVSGPHEEPMTRLECWMNVDLFSGLLRINVLDCSPSSVELFSEVEVGLGSASPWLPQAPCFHNCAASPSFSRSALRIHKPSRLPSYQSTWPPPPPVPLLASASNAPMRPRPSGTWSPT